MKILFLEKQKNCQIERQKEIAVARQFYQVSTDKVPRSNSFPISEVPWLNQTTKNIGLYYGFDDFEAGWLAGFKTWKTISDKIGVGLSAAFKNAPFESSKEFLAVRQGFNNAIKVNLLLISDREYIGTIFYFTFYEYKCYFITIHSSLSSF